MPLIILKWKKPAWKSAQNMHRIHENGEQNLQLRAQNFQYFGADFWQPY